MDINEQLKAYKRARDTRGELIALVIAAAVVWLAVFAALLWR